MTGSGKVPVTTPRKPVTDSNHSFAYPNNKKKKGWLCWNMKSIETILTHVSESRVFQSCLPFKSSPKL